MNLAIIIQENALAVIAQAAGVMLSLIIPDLTIADPVTQMMPQRTTIPVSVPPAMGLRAGAGLPPRIRD
jgi:hypothetical protein